MKIRISQTIKKRLVMLLVPILTLGALTVATRADHREEKDKGGQYEQVTHHGQGECEDVLAVKVKGQGFVDMVASADTFVPLNGIPTADLAYPINTEFTDNLFAIKATVHADGGATGTAQFIFGDEFANAWGGRRHDPRVRNRHGFRQ